MNGQMRTEEYDILEAKLQGQRWPEIPVDPHVQEASNNPGIEPPVKPSTKPPVDPTVVASAKLPAKPPAKPPVDPTVEASAKPPATPPVVDPAVANLPPQSQQTDHDEISISMMPDSIPEPRRVWRDKARPRENIFLNFEAPDQISNVRYQMFPKGYDGDFFLKDGGIQMKRRAFVLLQ